MHYIILQLRILRRRTYKEDATKILLVYNLSYEKISEISIRARILLKRINK